MKKYIKPLNEDEDEGLLDLTGDLEDIGFKNERFIDYEGYRYYYEHKPAKHRVDICLATKDPEKYCNGFYVYSDKDPGSGKCFVVTRHNNPNQNWESVKLDLNC